MQAGSIHRVRVAVAAIVNDAEQVLITRRHASAHQGGLWEFPGGKLEPGEPVVDALSRELHEELGIRPLRMRPLIRIRHDYSDKRVLLDTWRVDAYAGEATGREDQPLRWIAIGDLHKARFPVANRGIVTALRLPSRMLITPERGTGRHRAFVQALSLSVQRHALKLVQLRAKNIDAAEYLDLAKRALQACTSLGSEMMLNGDPEMLRLVDARGVHIPSARLARYRARPVDAGKYLSVAVHDEREIELACRLEPDFVLLSPVKRTASHPRARPLGWGRFSTLAGMLNVPVFALGGMQPADLHTAQQQGAQGIAAIGAFWSESSGSSDGAAG